VVHAEQAGDPEWQARALGGLGDAYYARSRMGTSLDYFRRCIALSQTHGLGRIEVANRYMVGVTRRYLNEFAEALDDVLAALDMARRVGNLRAVMYALNLTGEFRNDGGEWQQAEQPLQEALEIADTLGNRRFRAYVMGQQSRRQFLGGNPREAREIVAEATTISDATDPRFIGPRVYGIAALVAADDGARKRALEAGETIIGSGCAAHNHLWFYRDAIDACLQGADWDGAERFAAKLEAYTAVEPLPWSDFFAARGRALASHGRGLSDAATMGKIEQLCEQALAVGYMIAVPTLERALAKK
jgi:tetratricopeptide (TPR) repeat protein